jgi:hypothetical protein
MELRMSQELIETIYRMNSAVGASAVQSITLAPDAFDRLIWECRPMLVAINDASVKEKTKATFMGVDIVRGTN